MWSCLVFFVLINSECVFAQWQYGNYPRYGYVYSGIASPIGFGYSSPPTSYRSSPNTNQQQQTPRQTVANYYRSGSLTNPANYMRPLSPTNVPNVRVVDYNEMKAAAQQRLLAPQQGTTVNNPSQPTQQVQHQRQIPHPALQLPNQQYNTNRFAQSNQLKQHEMQKQREHQQKMIEHVQKIHPPQNLKPAQQHQDNPHPYPRQGLIADKSKWMGRQLPAFQSLNLHFGSSYLPSGAARAEELRGALGSDKPSMNWIQARTSG